ncbi:helicase-associated domain-containing protein [bacterium]|nr:helicase-associated domain-containing protein [bacterium]
MYLRDYLHDIPLKTLKGIARTLKVPVEYGARNKLINAVDRAFWDGSLAERLLRELPEESRRLLSLIAFSYGAGIHETALERKIDRLNGMKRPEVHRRLQELIPFALVGGIKEDETRYFCPKGIGEQVRRILIGKAVTNAYSAGSIPPATTPNLMEDIFSFLAEAYKDTIPLTLKGNIKKTFLEKVFEGSPSCADPTVNFQKEHRNAFVMEYLKNRKLIDFDHRKAHATEKLSGWLHLSAAVRFQDIVSFALVRTLQDHSVMTAFGGILGEVSPGTGFSISELANFLHTGTMAQGGFSRIEARIREILTILYHLGLISYKNGRFFMTVTGERFFRGDGLPIDGNSSDFFTVQPNFEIIVGPELNPLIRFKLELLTERLNRDIILTFMVTREGITRARERGMNTGEIVGFFDRHSRTPIPQNVRFSIESWAEAYGSIRFERTTLMRFRDTAVCSSVMHIPKIAPYVKERISDTVLVISGDRISAITDILKDTGYQPEIFGGPSADIIFTSETFTPVGIDEVVREKDLMPARSEFIIPDNLLSNGES